jgi:hypothetical protein
MCDTTNKAGGSNEIVLDKFGGWTAIKGSRTGFFHLEKIDGRDWFVTPDGNVFFPVALSHLLSGESCTAATRKFGDDKETWVRDSLKKAREMGFNCALGGASSPERNLNGFVDIDLAERIFKEEGFPYAVGVILIKHPWEFEEGETLPDLFDPEYKAMIEARAKAVCPRAKDDPLVMGYYNGYGAFNHSEVWVNHHLSMPAQSTGREAIVDFIQARYADNVDNFNTVYGMSLNSFDELRTSVELAYDKAFQMANFPEIGETLDPRQVADFNAILAYMCVTLYSMAHTAIRRWDENHLILGSFVKEWALNGEAWKAAAEYLDLIAPQHWSSEISINALADAAEKPMIVSDDEFGFHYPGNTGAMYKAVESHECRSEIYEASLMRHYKDPQVQGVSYCACLYDQDGASLERNIQDGLHDIDGAPRSDLVARITKLNKAVYAHSAEVADSNTLRDLGLTLKQAWDKYQVPNKNA